MLTPTGHDHHHRHHRMKQRCCGVYMETKWYYCTVLCLGKDVLCLLLMPIRAVEVSKRRGKGNERCIGFPPFYYFFTEQKQAEQAEQAEHIRVSFFFYSLLPWRVTFAVSLSLFHHFLQMDGWMDVHTQTPPGIFFSKENSNCVFYSTLPFYFYPILFYSILFYLEGEDPINQSINQSIKSIFSLCQIKPAPLRLFPDQRCAQNSSMAYLI